jgi:hypothetical protein
MYSSSLSVYAQGLPVPPGGIPPSDNLIQKPYELKYDVDCKSSAAKGLLPPLTKRQGTHVSRIEKAILFDEYSLYLVNINWIQRT